MLKEISELVVKSAREEILPRYRNVDRDYKGDGSVVTEADLAMQRKTKSALQQLWPSIAFVGEEMSEQEQRQQLSQSSDGAWILDPLDGTSNFASTIPFYSVSLALIKDGDVQLGVVYDPTRDELFAAEKGAGAWLNGNKLHINNAPAELKKTISLVDFKRLDAQLAQRIVRNPPYASQRSFGSVALDWCWIAAGRGHVYLHGKQKLWDYAAGWLILNEAGGYSSTLDGDVVFNGDLSARSAVAAADQKLFKQWCAFLNVTV